MAAVNEEKTPGLSSDSSVLFQQNGEVYFKKKSQEKQ